MSRRRMIGLSFALVLATLTGDADAACNLIPGTALAFPGLRGMTNRPFAAPGETLEVTVRPCDGGGGLRPTGAEHVVSVVFKPAAGGPGQLVAISTDCSSVDTASCPGSICQEVTMSDLTIKVRDGLRRLSFPFPSTDAELAPDLDLRTLAGPALVAVTAVGDPLPCGLKTSTCASPGSTLACVDQLFFDNGSCGSPFIHPTFGISSASRAIREPI